MAIVSIAIYFSACNKNNPEPRTALFNLNEVPFNNLSEYGFFLGELNNLEPHKDLVPYDLPTELFSNYATKQRLIYFPIDGKANFVSDNQRTLDFPEGTVIIKTFYYLNDFRDEALGRNILETRLLIRRNNEWEAYDYIWNEDQSDAENKISGKLVNVEWTHFDGSERSTLYAIPNTNECKACHELGEEMVLIGPKARYLNSDFNYESGTKNQLQNLADLGYLNGLPNLNEITQTADFQDNSYSLEHRARTYLDINCAHCHNAIGPANNTGMFLDYAQTDSIKLGVCKSPVAAGGGSGGLDFAIFPGRPEESILIHRLNSLELDVSMPELGRSVIHEEGLQLLTNWIEQLNGDCE